MLLGVWHSRVHPRFRRYDCVPLRGDDVQGFDARWDEVLLSTEEMPSRTHLHKNEVRTRNLEAQSEGTVTGAPAKKQKQRTISQALKGNREIAVSGKRKESLRKEALFSFRHDESKRGKITISSFPTPKSQANNDGTNSSKGRPP